jgi:hypothetical protein
MAQSGYSECREECLLLDASAGGQITTVHLSRAVSLIVVAFGVGVGLTVVYP